MVWTGDGNGKLKCSYDTSDPILKPGFTYVEDLMRSRGFLVRWKKR